MFAIGDAIFPKAWAARRKTAGSSAGCGEEVFHTGCAIKPGEHLLDATVFPSDITFPTDAGLLNKCRQWVVKIIKLVEKRAGVKEKARTYCRKAQKAYLGFQKRRRKTKREINLMRAKLLRYLRRNVTLWPQVIPLNHKAPPTPTD